MTASDNSGPIDLPCTKDVHFMNGKGNCNCGKTKKNIALPLDMTGGELLKWVQEHRQEIEEAIGKIEKPTPLHIPPHKLPPIGNYGWICPACQGGNAPWANHCPCSTPKYTIT